VLLFLLLLPMILPLFLLGRGGGATGRFHAVLGFGAAAVMLLWVVLFFFAVLRMLVRLSGLGQDPAARVARRRRARAGKRGLRALAFVGLAGTLIGIYFYAKNHHWPTRDWLLWPVDNILRTLDIADIMNIFDVRLHEVPRLPLAMALAVAFRLFVGVYLAELILYLRLRFQIALTTTELIDLLEAAKPQARRMAADTLGTRPEAADPTVPVLLRTVARDDNADVRLAAEDAIYRLGPTAAGVLLARLADYDLPEQCLEEELLARMRLDWRRH